MLVSFSLAMTSTVLSSATMLFMASKGWPYHQTEENCYENYLTDPDCFCERPRGSHPGDVWFAQPANTASNAAYVFVGLLIALACDLGLPRRHWNHSEKTTNTKTTRNVFYGTFFACIICLMGPTSAALHASLTSVGRFLDLICMYLIAIFLVLYTITRRMKELPLVAFFMAYMICTALALAMLLFSSDVFLKRAGFLGLNVLACVIDIVQGIRYGCNKVAYRYQVCAVMCFGFAIALWFSSQSAAPLCSPESVFQGHAAWHVLTAMALGFLFLYAISCDGVQEQDEGNKNDVADDVERGLSSGSETSTDNKESIIDDDEVASNPLAVIGDQCA